MIASRRENKKNGLSIETIFLLGAIIFIIVNLIRIADFDIDSSTLENFATVFLSIILEAIPFVMIGAFVSSIIQIFISEQTISRIIPQNRFIGLLIASLLGIVFPVCECAIIPIVRRLIRKGVPLHIAITFMVAVPIVNPVVLLSTYYAFSGDWYIVLLRGLLGLYSAILIGHIVGLLESKSNPIKELYSYQSYGCGHNHKEDSCGCSSHNSGINKKTVSSKLSELIQHTSAELYDVGKFLIIGAFLASIMQTFVSREIILSAGQGKISSILVMMGLAFVLSLCSEADAFIARTFLGQFTTGSIIAFLILGPMIDIKNTLMLSGFFKLKFVGKLIIVIFTICFIMSMLVNFIRI